MKIRVLDELTINKIAAGEVIENPASVVKELVENSIDAGSSEITIEIKGGGRQLIRITDNGCGMSFDDALLCLQPHATSKLHSIDDLHSLFTMGFRGEAIPSIAAISKFMLLTRPREEMEGALVRVEGGVIKTHAKSVCSPGTTVEVSSLFFNVPVRKKFQRSPTYDIHEIQKIVTKLCLANPHIRFQLISNEKPLLTTSFAPEGDFFQQLSDRIEAALGTDFFENLLPIDEEMKGVKLQGYIGFPAYTRPNRSEHYLFINRRAVVSPLISHAVKEGYGTALAANRYPVYVLHLTLATEGVDINVHPQKKEVRLQHDWELKEMILGSVQRALHHQEPAIELSLPAYPFTYEPFPEIQIEKEPEQTEFLFEAQKEVYASPKVLSTLNRFILIKNPEDQLALIDQKAAQARIAYEQLLKEEKREVQPLLIPYTFEVNALEANVIVENLALLQSMGFDVQEIGKNSFAIHALPANLEVNEVESLILEMVSELQNTQEHKKKLAQIAARYASAKVLSDFEAALLVKELMRCETTTHCPHGKPVMVSLNQEDLTNLFSKKSCIKKE
jgi:DNA mismatch repair protein MutL